MDTRDERQSAAASPRRVGGWALCVVCLGVATGSGCEVRLHEAGVYKGKVDPLVARSADEPFKETLRKRLKAYQADR